jgi:CTP synthase (UTP-ammonia lyase)
MQDDANPGLRHGLKFPLGSDLKQLLPPYRWDSLREPVRIALIGKYTVLADAYLSVIKALQHACMAANQKLELCWVEAQDLEEESKESSPEKYEAGWEQVSWEGARGGGQGIVWC